MKALFRQIGNINPRAVLFWILWTLAFLLVLALITWAGAGGWIDGEDPFPNADVIPDWLQGDG